MNLLRSITTKCDKIHKTIKTNVTKVFDQSDNGS